MTLQGHIDSYYAASSHGFENHTALNESIQTDICIVGGGYTGLSTALHLAEKGYQVTLLEAEKVGWGASGRNGGHVGVGQRIEQDALEKMVGLEHAKKLWQYGIEAADLVKDLIAKHNIDCDMKQGIIHLASKHSHVDGMEEDIEHLYRVYGYEDARYCDKAEVGRMIGSKGFHAGHLDNRSVTIHPLNYLLGLAKAAKAAGVTIYENSQVTSIDYKTPAVIHTDNGQVTAKTLVLACNGYLGKLNKKAAGKIMPINNFVIATEPLPEQMARELIRDDVGVQDSLFVINYWRLSGDNRLVFGGGENYTSKFPKDIKSFVQKCMLRIYPQLQATKIDYGWGGTLAITMNRMPHFNRPENNVYVAHGYSGHGIPTATFAGKVLAEAISGDSEKFDVFESVPTHTFPGGTWLRWPGLVAGMSYYALLDRIGS